MTITIIYQYTMKTVANLVTKNVYVECRMIALYIELYITFQRYIYLTLFNDFWYHNLTCTSTNSFYKHLSQIVSIRMFLYLETNGSLYPTICNSVCDLKVFRFPQNFVLDIL